MSDITFSINDIEEVATENSVEFAKVKLLPLSTRVNSHNINITKEILKRDIKTILGKWIVAKYDEFQKDATTHVTDETIVGIIPQDAKLEFVENEDGTLSAWVEAIISKLYATDVYKMFRDENFRHVSVEMGTYGDRVNENGSTDIDGFNIYAVTILGKKVMPSCPDAQIVVTQFNNLNSNDANCSKFAFHDRIINLANDLLLFAENIKDKEEKMENTNFESESNEEKDIVMESDSEKMEEIEEKENEESVEEKDMSCGDNKELEDCGDNKEFESTEENTDIKEENSEESLSCDSAEKKEFCFIECVDSELLSTESRVAFAEKLKEMDANTLFSEFLRLYERNVEYTKLEEEEKEKERLKVFSSIMDEVSNVLGKEDYNSLYNEGLHLKVEELNAFRNKVKAFAYDLTKNKLSQLKNEDEDLAYGSSETHDDSYNNFDVFDRIAKSINK